MVSIHPMCRFKFLSIYQIDYNILFQYILCVGSRELEHGNKAEK